MKTLTNQTLILIAASAVAIPLSAQAAKRSKQPNILFIMTDDHTSQAIGAYNTHLSKLNPTPTIDALVQEGVLFENVFCNNSISTPSRATIMTGQYSHTNGVLTLDDHLDTEQQHLAVEMKKLGYQTAVIGKWHLGCEPTAFDFYSVFTQYAGQGAYFDPLTADSRNKDKKYPNNTIKHKGHSSDIITDMTMEWIGERDKSKPFFVLHHFKAPHGYFEYHTRYADYLKDVDIPVPATLLNREGFGSVGSRGEDNSLERFIGTSISKRNVHHNYVKEFKIDLGDDDKNTLAAYDKYMKDYLRCVKGVDDNMERLFQYLKDEGLWDNTIIVYTSDQGMMLGEHDLQDKRWMYDESLRMPYIMRVPGAKVKNQRNDMMIQNVDFAPTLLALAGAEKTRGYMQGEDFSSVFLGQEIEGWRDAIYYRYWMHMIHHNVPAQLGIRTKDYKLIFLYGRHYDPSRYGEKTFAWIKTSTALIVPTPVSFELYDLRKDPHETTNVADDPKYSEVLKRLKRELLALKLKVGDSDTANPEIQKIINDNF
ncbi:MAG: sulfatase [Rikenellaceae bacterium]